MRRLQLFEFMDLSWYPAFLRDPQTNILALKVPDTVTGVRTIFTGFHHFTREQVRMILLDAKEKQQALCIFDYVPNKLLTLFLFPLSFVMSFLQFYILSFFVRTLSVPHLLVTNVIPIVPLVSAWDGFVSAMRKYSARELREISAGIPCEDYEVEIGEDFSLSKASPMTYLLGMPSGRKR